ncbi:uncharacterized protein LOC118436920 [Folsomia candida]|uniref:uncharacterized protein LOC118436920 n=1 Tax=Folsomia candida TaxID=158441 RepID=UPI0016052AFC|nr:uncharacterized protein LOC118436920 [Folsomia candida]
MHIECTNIFEQVYLTIFRALCGLMFYKKITSFWSEFVSVLKNVDAISTTLKSPRFIQIKSSIRKDFLVKCVFASLSQLYFMAAIIFSTTGQKIGFKLELFIRIVKASIPNLTMLFHILVTIWATFPLKVAKGLLQSLKDELTAADKALLSEKLLCINIEKWVKAYGNVASLMKIYSRHFGTYLILEIGNSAVQILCQTFSALSWILIKYYGPAVMRIPPILTSVTIIYQLASEAETVTELQEDVFECFAGLEEKIERNERMRVKINSLLRKMAMNRLQVKPGKLFVLNRRLITSILSTVITFIVVLIQFRDGETTANNAGSKMTSFGPKN